MALPAGAILPAWVALLRVAGRTRAGAAVYRRLPEPLWNYLTPLAFVAAGWISPQDPFYTVALRFLLPWALALLLLETRLDLLGKLGLRATAAVFAGSAGIAAGMLCAFALLKPWMEAEAWRSAGALAATWTGGSLNLVAVAAALEIPAPAIGALVVVDAVLAYSWMSLLLALTGSRESFDAWLRALPLDPPSIERGETGTSSKPLAAAVASVIAALGLWLAPMMPETEFISERGWALILVTFAALAASAAAPLRRAGASAADWGRYGLLLVLAVLGAQAGQAEWSAAGLWLVAGAVTLAIHALILLAVGRVLRLPLGALAAVSQANVGGMISGPLVAGAYHAALIPLGLITAVACGACGTFIGLVTAWACRGL